MRFLPPVFEACAGDIAAQHLARTFLRKALTDSRDDLRADRRLNRDVEHLARNQLAHLRDPSRRDMDIGAIPHHSASRRARECRRDRRRAKLLELIVE
jgi:hypothetical protein